MRLKLDNKGWGTTEMLLLSGALLFALIVAIFFISQLYGSLGNSLSNKEYVDLENKIEEAGRDYIKKNDITVSGEYKISLSTLQNDDVIDELKDSSGNLCDGYVTISRVDNINYYKGFINCNDYKTANY